MNTARRKLPIGVQSFKKLREFQFEYVDKTAYIARLVSESVQYFLRDQEDLVKVCFFRL